VLAHVARKRTRVGVVRSGGRITDYDVDRLALVELLDRRLRGGVGDKSEDGQPKCGNPRPKNQLHVIVLPIFLTALVAGKNVPFLRGLQGCGASQPATNQGVTAAWQ
jgi:hypothetical protein